MSSPPKLLTQSFTLESFQCLFSSNKRSCINFSFDLLCNLHYTLVSDLHIVNCIEVHSQTLNNPGTKGSSGPPPFPVLAACLSHFPYVFKHFIPFIWQSSFKQATWELVISNFTKQYSLLFAPVIWPLGIGLRSVFIFLVCLAISSLPALYFPLPSPDILKYITFQAKYSIMHIIKVIDEVEICSLSLFFNPIKCSLES